MAAFANMWSPLPRGAHRYTLESDQPAERPTEALSGFEGTYHPEVLVNTAKRYAIVRANRIMVDTCDWLVCYVRHGASNSWKLLEYAQRRAARGLIQIENIGENDSGE